MSASSMDRIFISQVCCTVTSRWMFPPDFVTKRFMSRFRSSKMSLVCSAKFFCDSSFIKVVVSSA